ncbi:hypothetical protein [Aliamphritea spongicola]|nr:hypothetical protein [Aliamphritea spongicola]
MRKSLIIAITTATVGLTTLGIGAAQADSKEGYGCGKGEHAEYSGVTVETTVKAATVNSA